MYVFDVFCVRLLVRYNIFLETATSTVKTVAKRVTVEDHKGAKGRGVFVQ